MRDPARWSNPWRSTKALLAAAIVSQILACASALPIGFDEEAPDGRIHAIIDAARTRDTARIPDIIAQLDSDDPAVRLFAIRTLELLTDQTLGYHHADPLATRETAIDNWVRWLAAQHDADTPANRGTAK